MIDLLKRNPYALILALLFHLALVLLFRVSPEVKFMDSAAPIESQLEDEAPQDDPDTEVNEALPEDAVIVVVEESLLAEKLLQLQKSKNRQNVLGLKMPEDPRVVAMREKAKEEQRRRELEELEKRKAADKKAADKKAADKKAADKKAADKKAADKKAADKKAADKKAADKKAADKKAADKKAADKKAADKKAAEKKAADKKAADKKAADKKAADKKAADKKAADKKAADKKKTARKKSNVSGTKSKSGKSEKSGNARKKGASSGKGKSGGTGGGGSGRHSGAGGGKNYDKFISQIRSKITRNWRKPSGIDSGLTTSLRVKLFPGGAVADVSVARSSGNPMYDRSAQDAVKKASPLPVPKGSAFDKFRSLTLKFSPTGIR